MFSIQIAILASSATKPKSAATKKKSAVTAVPKYLDGPFDDTLTALPPNFIGNSIEKVYETHSLRPKGEFETTSQFEAWKRAVPSATYAFRLEDASPIYDADRAVFTFSVSLSPILDYRSSYSSDESPGLTIRQVETSRREYQASNALGATVTVESVTSKEYVVLSETHRGHASLKLEVAVPPEDAPTMKPRIRVLAICRMGPDLATLRSGDADGSSSTYLVKATYDAPTEILIHYYAVRAELVGFWVYDIAAGRILGRFDAFGNSSEIQFLPASGSTANLFGVAPGFREVTLLRRRPPLARHSVAAELTHCTTGGGVIGEP